MMGGTSQMIWGTILSIALQIGFAYIVWVFAAKEKGALKITGMIISGVIAVASIVILVNLLVRVSPWGAKPSPMYGPGGMSREQIEQMMKERGVQPPAKQSAPAPKAK